MTRKAACRRCAGLVLSLVAALGAAGCGGKQSPASSTPASSQTGGGITTSTSVESTAAPSAGQTTKTTKTKKTGTAKTTVKIQTSTTDTPGGSMENAMTFTLKKGISASRYGGGNAADIKKLTDLGVGWYYNWGSITPPDGTGMEYVPMVWGPGSMGSGNLSKIKALADQGVYKNLLTFNEPDLKEQSNMTVEKALEYWPQLEALGLRLSSPAPAVYSNNGWLDQFMKEAIARGYRVDFIALHFYQNYSDPGSVEYLKNTLTEIYNKYQLPIWITEIGMVDTATWTGGYTAGCYVEANATKYVREVTAMLESLGFVERYAWFVDNFQQSGDQRPKEAPFTALYNDDNTLSSSGSVYKSVASQKALLIQNKTLPSCVPGTYYRTSLSVSGGTAPYTYTASGLPSGLSLDKKTGRISGAATDAGSHMVTFTVTDSKGQSTHKSFQLIDSANLRLVKLAKTGWKGNAAYYGIPSGWQFQNNDAPQIVDGKANTTYTMNRVMTTNDVFQALFPKQISVKKIVLTSPNGQYAENFKVLYCKIDAAGKENWVAAPTESVTIGTTTEITFQDVLSTTGIMVQLTRGDSGKTWALSEFDAYGYGV